jgi:prepilin signal peptidase PulO-like enzyme (type II secretory pathway)
MNLFQILLFAQQSTEDIKQKMENAPNDNYEIGVVIGTYLPFVLFIIFAYVVYYFAKNRKD